MRAWGRGSEGGVMAQPDGVAATLASGWGWPRHRHHWGPVAASPGAL